MIQFSPKLIISRTILILIQLISLFWMVTSLGVYISQLIRFARASSNLSDFNCRNKALTAKLLRQGHRYFKLRKALSKIYCRHSAFVEIYIVSLEKKVREKSRECHNHKSHKSQPFTDAKRKRKPTKQTSTNRTNVRKILRLALSFPSEVIAMLKGLKTTRIK